MPEAATFRRRLQALHRECAHYLRSAHRKAEVLRQEQQAPSVHPPPFGNTNMPRRQLYQLTHSYLQAERVRLQQWLEQTVGSRDIAHHLPDVEFLQAEYRECLREFYALHRDHVAMSDPTDMFPPWNETMDVRDLERIYRLSVITRHNYVRETRLNHRHPDFRSLFTESNMHIRSTSSKG
jgi:hypothetical protein